MFVQERSQYDIHSFAPATGFLAVYSLDVKSRVEIETRPFDFVCSANVRVNRGGKWIDEGSEFVGVNLVDGDFEIVTNCQNFHGFVRNVASWDDCVELLPSELRSRVTKPMVTATIANTFGQMEN